MFGFFPHIIQSSWVWKVCPFLFSVLTKTPNGGQHLRKRTFAHISQKTAFGAARPQKRLGFVGLKWRWGSWNGPIFPSFSWWQMKVWKGLGMRKSGKCVYKCPGGDYWWEEWQAVLIPCYTAPTPWYIKIMRARPMKMGIKDRYTIGSCRSIFSCVASLLRGNPFERFLQTDMVFLEKTQGAFTCINGSVILRRFPQQNLQLNSMNPFFKVFCRQSWK